MSTIPCADLRRGVHVVRNGELLEVVDHEHRMPGNLPSKLRIWFKSVRTGAVIDTRLHPDDRIKLVHVKVHAVTYLYRDGERFVFLDDESCEQPELPHALVKPLIGLLKEGNPATLTVCDGEPIRVELPPQVALQVTEAEPGIRGATASDQYKIAVLETGRTVKVPRFIEAGDVILIDTRTGEYAGRAK